MPIQRSKIENWIEAGKQIGVVFTYISADQETVWCSAAIQKHNGRYLVYLEEILESKMVAEEFLREDLFSFLELQTALTAIEQSSQAKVEDLRPRKGQKIFNPYHPPTFIQEP